MKTLTKADAQRQLSEAREALNRYEAEEERALNSSLVGKCFRYRNCYSCPETESDYWWLYLRVTGLSDSGNPIAIVFQTDKDGQTTVTPEKVMHGQLMRPGGNYREIRLAEWLHARDEMLARVRMDSEGHR